MSTETENKPAEDAENTERKTPDTVTEDQELFSKVTAIAEGWCCAKEQRNREIAVYSFRAGYLKAHHTARTELNAAKAELLKVENSALELIDERDSAETVIEDLLKVLGLHVGTDYEWSSSFGFQEAVSLAEDALQDRIHESMEDFFGRLTKVKKAAAYAAEVFDSFNQCHPHSAGMSKAVAELRQAIDSESSASSAGQLPQS